MSVVINPGSGPVAGAEVPHAEANMRHFIADAEGQWRFVRLPADDNGDGRFTYLMWRGAECHTIQMPGLPLDKVRWMGEEGQNIWHYPRLYVDYSSWVWKYALGALHPEEQEATL